VLRCREMPRLFRTSVASAGVLLTLSGYGPTEAFGTSPWEEIMGPPKPVLWNDPQARFYLDLPYGWKAKLFEDHPDIVDFSKQHDDFGYVAHVIVRMQKLPSGVQVQHYAERKAAENRNRWPRYQLIEEAKSKVSGERAYRTRFTFEGRNNIELTTQVTQYVFVTGQRGFAVSLFCSEGTCSYFEEDFQRMVDGFVARGIGEESLPVPKQRKRIKAGEVIDPNAIRY
jgi:hypothetical protein